MVARPESLCNRMMSGNLCALVLLRVTGTGASRGGEQWLVCFIRNRYSRLFCDLEPVHDHEDSHLRSSL